ncbi:g2227 [Coccomyxa elongata]
MQTSLPTAYMHGGRCNLVERACLRTPASHLTPKADLSPHQQHGSSLSGNGHVRNSLWSCRLHAAAESVASTSDQDDPLVDETGTVWPAKKQVRSSQEAISTLGLGTWRLRGRVGGPFEALAAQIEGAWRQYFPRELRLYPLPEDLKFCDSMDVDKSVGIWSYIDLPDPDKGVPGYPRLLIENRAYATKAFRKLHMELAHRQDGLQVLHCVLYPRLEYDLPILCFDMVGSEGSGRVSLAIADPCPASMDRSLPQVYVDAATLLQEQFGLESNRGIPEWGRDIFSDMCVIVRPEDPDELSRFIQYCIALHQTHLILSQHARPVTEYKQKEQRLADVRSAHERYCSKQQENAKTRRVLEAAFGGDFATRYMTEIMFDSPAGAGIAAS